MKLKYAIFSVLIFWTNQGYSAPNFLFIISDDQKLNTGGSGSADNPDIQTPNHDRLSDAGLTFTHAFNMGSYSGAICVASRAMLNTGTYVWQTRDDVGSETLWAEYFEQAGYNTFVTGKWHVSGGGLSETQSAEKAFETGVALGKGFYESESNDFSHYNRPAENGNWAPDDESMLGHWSPSVWDITDHTIGNEYTVQTHTSELFATSAVDFINSREPGDKPFFMYVAFTAPHDPKQAPTEFVNMYSDLDPFIPPNLQGQYPWDLSGQRDNRVTSYPITEESYTFHLREYYAMITHMDHHIGRILDALEASGLADSTYVIYTSDHGLGIGEHGYMGKQILYDHSVRLPFIITGPGIIPDSKQDAMIYMQSVVPTTLELAGINVPGSIDFPSLTGLINNTESGPFQTIYGGLFANDKPQRMARSKTHKLIMYPWAPEYFLFDLVADPWETTNLIDNPLYGKIAMDLLRDYHVWQTDLQDPYTMPWLDFSAFQVDDAETDKITYTGNWNHQTRSVSIENTISLTAETGATAELTFEGLDVRLYVQRGAGAGIFEIYLDDVLVDTYDSYAPAQQNKILAYESDLVPGTHTLSMVNTGNNNTGATGTNMHLDMISYNGVESVVSVPEPGLVMTPPSQRFPRTIQVFNLKGKLAAEYTVQRGDQIDFTFHSLHLKPGMYFLGPDVGGLKFKKIVVVH